MSRWAGPPFLAFGLRHQPKEGPMPLLHSGGQTWVTNLEDRIRYIAMGGKGPVIWNRVASKQILYKAMQVRHHSQDRNLLSTTISKWIQDPNIDVVAADVSSFDKKHGGPIMKIPFEIFGRLLHDSRVADDFLAEVEMPMIVPYQRGLYMTEDRIAPQIPSGVSSTTIQGLFWGDYISRYIGKELGLPLSGLGKTWDYFNWGDDILLAVPKKVQIDTFFSKISDKLDITLTREPTVKYLGFNYGSGEYEARIGYSVGRLVSKIFLPEG
jgi:hypothetical protein